MIIFTSVSVHSLDKNYITEGEDQTCTIILSKIFSFLVSPFPVIVGEPRVVNKVQSPCSIRIRIHNN